MLLEASGVSSEKPFPRPDMGPAFLVQQASFWTRCCSSQHVKCVLHSFIPVGWATLAVQPQHVEGPFNPDNQRLFRYVQVVRTWMQFKCWSDTFLLPTMSCHMNPYRSGKLTVQVGASGTAECIQMSVHFY